MNKRVFISLAQALLSSAVSFVFLSGIPFHFHPAVSLTILTTLFFLLFLGMLSRGKAPTPAPKPPKRPRSRTAEGEGAPAPGPGAGVAENRGYEVYKRALRHMEEDKPYLDSKLNLARFAHNVYSNKVYVSRNINYYSGRNFCQFVNYYRVEYAVSLIKRDPHLRMEEVAAMSGFHSVVSFNMAFRLFKSKTPTQWQEDYLDAKKGIV